LTDFGWTRLAYLLVVLSVLAVLAQLGSPSADPGNCPPNSRQATHGRGSPVAAREPHGHEDASLQASAAREPGIPAFARHLKRATAGEPSVAVSDSGRATFYRPSAPRTSPQSSGEAVLPTRGGIPEGARRVRTKRSRRRTSPTRAKISNPRP
jgi:hypothetical protein